MFFFFPLVGQNKNWMLLVQTTFLGENEYVGHTSKSILRYSPVEAVFVKIG